MSKTAMIDIVIIISAIVMIGAIIGTVAISSSPEENLTEYSVWNTLRLGLIYIAIGAGSATGLLAFLKKKAIL